VGAPVAAGRLWLLAIVLVFNRLQSPGRHWRPLGDSNPCYRRERVTTQYQRTGADKTPFNQALIFFHIILARSLLSIHIFVTNL
jgi:hypothetical protein